jgi:hypothetical protein
VRLARAALVGDLRSELRTVLIEARDRPRKPQVTDSP